MEERCVMCGEIVPEGRQVCPSCEQVMLRVGMIIQSQEATNEEIEKAYKSLQNTGETI